MKILIVSDLYYPVINGISTFTRNLARGLASHGHEVAVIAPSQTGKKSKEVDGNYVIIRTSSIEFPIYRNILVSLYPAKEVKKIIQDFEPDIIHIQLMMWIGQAAMKYGNKFGIPIVSTNHAMPENLMDNLKLLAPVSKPINYILSAYGARFHSKADFVTLPTQSAIDMFNANDKIDVPMVAVSNGIDLSKFTPTPPAASIYAEFKIPKNKPIVSYIGRIDAEKHLAVLMRAFIKVKASIPDAHLMFVGDGSDVAILKKMAAEAGISHSVIFTGRVSDEALVELHKVGTVYCMPSPTELQSIATLEAMASAKPIVAIDAGALRELCQDGRNGYLCEQDNVQEIADGLTKIMSDPALREKMSQESLAIARTHDLQSTLKRFLAIYETLIKA